MSRVSSWSNTVSSAFDPERYGTTTDTTTSTTDTEEEEVAATVAVVPGTSSELFNLFAEAASSAGTSTDTGATADRNAWLANVELPSIAVEFYSEDD